MAKTLIVRANDYHDSIQLMLVSRGLRELPGVTQAFVAMGSDANKEILAQIGLSGPAAAQATANDMMVAIEAASEAALGGAVSRLDRLLEARAAGRGARRLHGSLEEAVRALPGANLCVISVPGEYAAAEARKALEAGLHVFVYSDNVPLGQERELKELAGSKGLLCMGPDCGVANLNGIALGTASVARRGPVGIVGASGSGTQQIAVIADKEGLGVSQAIGVGGKDLRDEIGGLQMLAGMEALEEDPATRVIVLVSRAPGPQTLPRILDRVKACRKPVVICFMGADRKAIEASGAVFAGDTEDAGFKAVDLARGRPLRSAGLQLSQTEVEAIVRRETGRMAREQRWLRGLFVGGTFAEEAMTLAGASVGEIRSNAPLAPHLVLRDPRRGEGHAIIDLGDEEFTRGRAHPGIDPAPIRQAILREGADPEVAVLLLDFILGPALNPDPAGSVIAEIRKARADREAAGGYLAVVAAVCGTGGDPQGLAQQERVLREAGVVLMPSNGQAARLAGLIARAAGKRR